jgi:hypothetical protein
VKVAVLVQLVCQIERLVLVVSVLEMLVEALVLVRVEVVLVVELEGVVLPELSEQLDDNSHWSGSIYRRALLFGHQLDF